MPPARFGSNLRQSCDFREDSKCSINVAPQERSRGYGRSRFVTSLPWALRGILPLLYRWATEA